MSSTTFCLTLCAFLASIVVLSVSGSALANAQLAPVLSGYVYLDDNENGVMDAGEEPVRREVCTDGPGTPCTMSDRDGYSFSAPGETISVTLAEPWGISCQPENRHVEHFPVLPCLPVTWDNLARATSPSSVPIPGNVSEARIDFGLQIDQMQVQGQALVNGNYPAPGTPVTTDPPQCGTALDGSGTGSVVSSSYGIPRGAGHYSIYLQPAAVVPGCFEVGDTVRLYVGGILAEEALSFTGRDADCRQDALPPCPPHHALNLIILPDHAWYWSRVSAVDSQRYVGKTVAAVIDGKVCGTAILSVANFALGFGRLPVARESITPGCGGTGKLVSFTIDGQPAKIRLESGEQINNLEWQPGVQHVWLVASAVSPAPTPAQLPSTGGPSGSQPGPVSPLMGLLGGIVAVIAATGWTRIRR